MFIRLAALLRPRLVRYAIAKIVTILTCLPSIITKNFLTSIKLLKFVCLTSSAHFYHIVLMLDVILSALENRWFLNFTYDITSTTLLSSDYRCNFGDKKSSRVSDCFINFYQNRQRFSVNIRFTKDLLYSKWFGNARVFGKN